MEAGALTLVFCVSVPAHRAGWAGLAALLAHRVTAAEHLLQILHWLHLRLSPCHAGPAVAPGGSGPW